MLLATYATALRAPAPHTRTQTRCLVHAEPRLHRARVKVLVAPGLPVGGEDEPLQRLGRVFRVKGRRRRGPLETLLHKAVDVRVGTVAYDRVDLVHLHERVGEGGDILAKLCERRGPPAAERLVHQRLAVAKTELALPAHRRRAVGTGKGLHAFTTCGKRRQVPPFLRQEKKKE
eukprot:1849713-Rhodomonas_salina.2